MLTSEGEKEKGERKEAADLKEQRNIGWAEKNKKQEKRREEKKKPQLSHDRYVN